MFRLLLTIFIVIALINKASSAKASSAPLRSEESSAKVWLCIHNGYEKHKFHVLNWISHYLTVCEAQRWKNSKGQTYSNKTSYFRWHSLCSYPAHDRKSCCHIFHYAYRATNRHNSASHRHSRSSRSSRIGRISRPSRLNRSPDSWLP